MVLHVGTGTANTVAFSLRLDGVLLSSGSDSGPVRGTADTEPVPDHIYTTFHEIAFNPSTSTAGTDFLIDNVSVELVPEPSSAALLLAGGWLLGSRARQRSR